MRRVTATLAAAAMALPVTLIGLPAAADSERAAVGFGLLYHDGDIVRTVITPASIPGKGVDPIFAINDGVAEQLAVTSVAPGTPGYHGGRWAVYVVDWNVTPYLLTSDEAVGLAQSEGDVTVTRMPAADFVCPVTG
ncbi:hypothetical protein E1262_28725 [Jiangella aurantiaca]|uniref:Uncharacterized protein n=1 Tax=Jiangella aurantiaca TaxID=2530373 RepID=A0A4R4ZZ08_9ACTN|nr:hypothetical protein [Jiangella aurantiaca]TDD64285.1 hypothetical protein E1262_28725 [Jiangella aurantiaca]